MRTLSLFLLALGLVGAAIVALWLTNRDATPSVRAEPPPAPAALPSESASFVGSASCAGRSCHGGIDAVSHVSIGQNEFTRWISADPHRDAYAVLLNERSVRMAKQLGISNAHESPRCLACHTTPGAAVGNSERMRHERSAGVGCESCHGNATTWLNSHLASGWQIDQGMLDVRDPAILARTCAGCHVGAPPALNPVRDVNHDLIAAGHPRLAFEFSAFFANLPPHWKQRPMEEGKRWAIGQVASAEAALELLKDRAGGEVWPEFAEYDCFACHHHLGRPIGEATAKGGRRSGSLAWGTWYFALPPFLAGESLDLAPLAAAMEKTIPDRGEIAQHAESVGRKLRSLQSRWRAWQESEDSRAMIDALLKDRRNSTGVSSWDEAEQRFLGLYALNQTARDRAIAGRLQELLSERAFRPDLDSPLSLPGKSFDSAAFTLKLRGVLLTSPKLR